MAAALAVVACANPERPLLEQFFSASRLRDRTTLQSIATIVFEPREHGIVRSFEIAAVTPERTEGPLAVKEVTLVAPVALPDGRTVQKTLIVTMERQAADRSHVWRVTAVRDAAASPAVPPS
jgi:hypothetical protein